MTATSMKTAMRPTTTFERRFCVFCVFMVRILLHLPIGFCRDEDTTERYARCAEPGVNIGSAVGSA